jgi:hypothetical protein
MPQAAQREGQRTGRRNIEPWQVIDDNQHRLFPGQRAEQGEYRRGRSPRMGRIV